MRDSDADAYGDLINDPEEGYFVAEEATPQTEIVQKIRRHRQASITGGALYWSIEHCNCFIGFVALHALESTSPALSYAVARRHRRIGVASEAIRMVLDYAQKELRVLEVKAATHLENVASASLLLSLGFEDVGASEARDRREFVWRRDA